MTRLRPAPAVLGPPLLTPRPPSRCVCGHTRTQHPRAASCRSGWCLCARFVAGTCLCGHVHGAAACPIPACGCRARRAATDDPEEH